MKKLLIVLFLFIPLALFGQKNALSFVFHPTDLGLGLRYDRKLNNDIGLYTLASYGNYRYDKNNFIIRDHYKASLGVVKYLPTPNYNTFAILSFGLSYHRYGQYDDSFIEVPQSKFYPLSMEFGAGGQINKFNAGFVFDPLKWEGGFYFGFYF